MAKCQAQHIVPLDAPFTTILYIFIFFTFRLSFHKQLCSDSISEIFNVFIHLSCRDTIFLY